MLLADVLGRLWTDRRVAYLEGVRLVVVREVTGDAVQVAVDPIGVSAGNRVLVATEEAARDATGGIPVDAAIVGLVAGMDEWPMSEHHRSTVEARSGARS